MRSCRWVAMGHHGSDNRMLVLRVETNPAGVKLYEKDRRTLPVPPLPRPLAYRDTVFAELVEVAKKLSVRKRPENVWICLGT